jgi:hypothetical protein
MTARSLSVFLLAMAACGTEIGSSPTTEPPAPVEGEDQVKAAWCEALVRCELFPDLDTCMNAIDVVGSDVREAVDGGNASYDAVEESACEDALAEVTCEQLTGAPDLDPCGHIWDGTVPDGDACAGSAECASGFCDPGECDPAITCCTGSCASGDDQAGVAIGGDCSEDDCTGGAYCDWNAAPATCRALVALEGACSEGQCVDGLYCRLTDLAAGTGVCSDLPAEGEACDPDYPVCARGDNWCDPADNTCHRLAAVGDACDEASDNCVAYAWCSPDGVCVARPTEGEPCEDWPPCMGDLECVDDTCVIPPLDEDSGCD